MTQVNDDDQDAGGEETSREIYKCMSLVARPQHVCWVWETFPDASLPIESPSIHPGPGNCATKGISGTIRILHNDGLLAGITAGKDQDDLIGTKELGHSVSGWMQSWVTGSRDEG